MISTKTYEKIMLICYATISGMFADYCHPDFNRESFSWLVSFTELAKSQCRAQVFLSNVHTEKNINECLHKAEEISEMIAKELLKRAGLE